MRAADHHTLFVQPVPKKGCFMSISDALREAHPNSVILISSGRYVEPTLQLDKPGITLQAAGDGLPVITSYGASMYVSAGVQLVGLHIATETPGMAALVIVAGSPTVSRCQIQSLQIDMNSAPIIEHCNVVGSQRCGVVICGASKAELRNTTIKNHRLYGLFIMGATCSPVIANCSVQQTGMGCVAVCGGATPVFKTNTIQDTPYTPTQSTQQAVAQNSGTGSTAGGSPSSTTNSGGTNYDVALAAVFPSVEDAEERRVAILVSSGARPLLESNTVFSSVKGAITCTPSSDFLSPAIVAFCVSDGSSVATVAGGVTFEAGAISAGGGDGGGGALAPNAPRGARPGQPPPPNKGRSSAAPNKEQSSSTASPRKRGGATADDSTAISMSTMITLSHNIIRDNAGVALTVRGGGASVVGESNRWDSNEKGCLLALQGGTIALTREDIGMHMCAAVAVSDPGSLLTLEDVTAAASKVGFHASNRAILRIYRSTIEKMEKAGTVTSGARLEMNHCNLSGNDIGITVEDYGTAYIDDSQFTGNSVGIVSQLRGDPRATRCAFKRNGQGVLSTYFGRGVVENCTFTESTLCHIATSLKGNTTFLNNVLSDNKTAPAIWCHESGLGHFMSNSISNQRVAAIKVDSAADPTVIQTRFESCAAECVVVERAGLGTFVGNHIRAAGASGVLVRAGGDPTFRDNTIATNAVNGIELCDGARGVYEKNTITDNLESGVCVSGSNTFAAIVTRNHISRHPIGVIGQDHCRALVACNNITESKCGVKLCRGANLAVVRNTIASNDVGVVAHDDATGTMFSPTSGAVASVTRGSICYNMIEANLTYGVHATGRASPLLMGNTICCHDRGVVASDWSSPRVLQCVVSYNRVGIEVTSVAPVQLLDTVPSFNGFGARCVGNCPGGAASNAARSKAPAAAAAPTTPSEMPVVATAWTGSGAATLALTEVTRAAAALLVLPPIPHAPNGAPIAPFVPRHHYGNNTIGSPGGPAASPPQNGSLNSTLGGAAVSMTALAPGTVLPVPADAAPCFYLDNVVATENGVALMVEADSAVVWCGGTCTRSAKGGVIVAATTAHVLCDAVVFCDNVGFHTRIVGPDPAAAEGSAASPLQPSATVAAPPPPSDIRRIGSMVPRDIAATAAAAVATAQPLPGASPQRPVICHLCLFVGPNAKNLVQYARSAVHFRSCAALSCSYHITQASEAQFVECVSKLRADLSARNVGMHVNLRAKALIHGCAVSGFDEGIKLDRCDATIVATAVSYCGWTGVHIGHATTATIESCHVFRNGGAGIKVVTKMQQGTSIIARSKVFNQVSTFGRSQGGGGLLLSGTAASGAGSPREGSVAASVQGSFRVSRRGSGGSRGGLGATISGSVFDVPFFELPDVSEDEPFTGVESDTRSKPETMTVPKYSCPPTDGPGVGIFVESQGVLLAEGCEVFGNAISNVVVASSKGRSVWAGGAIYGGEGYGLVARGSALAEVRDCYIAANCLAGFLCELQSSIRLSGSVLKSNPIGVICVGENTEVSRCSFEDSRICGMRFSEGSISIVSDCIFARNATGVEARQNVTTAPTLSRCDFKANVYSGAMCTASSRATFNDCRFRNHHGVCGVMVRCGASPSLTNCIFEANTYAVIGRMYGAPQATGCIIRNNTTGLLAEWASGGTFERCMFHNNASNAVMSRTAAEPTVSGNTFFEDSPIIVSTEGRGTFEKNTFIRPKSNCFVVTRGGDPIIARTTFSCAHATASEMIMFRMAIQKNVREMKDGAAAASAQPSAVPHQTFHAPRPTEIAAALPAGPKVHFVPMGGATAAEGSGGASMIAAGGASAIVANDAYDDGSLGSAEDSPINSPMRRSMSNFGRTDATGAPVDESTRARLRVPVRFELGAKGCLRGNAFAFNAPCSVLVESSLTECRLDSNFFYGHRHGEAALMVSNHANPTVVNNIFVHNDCAVSLTRTPAILSSNTFIANYTSVESDTNVTGLVSSCTFVDDVVSISVQRGSGLAARKNTFIRVKTAAIMRKDAQGTFADNSCYATTGPALIMQNGGGKALSVERCTFVKCKSGVEVAPGTNATLYALEMYTCAEYAIHLNNVGSVSLRQSKLSLNDIGIVCEGAACIPFIEDTVVQFNRLGLETINAANPTCQSCKVIGNKIGFMAHSEGFGTCRRVEFIANTTGVIIRSAVEGLPVISQCNILDSEEIGLMIGNDGAGELTDTNIFDCKCCVQAETSACTLITECTFSHPDPRPSAGQPDSILRRVNHSGEVQPVEEGKSAVAGFPKLVVAPSVQLCYDRIPPYSQIQSRMRKAENIKTRSQLLTAMERFVANYAVAERDARDAVRLALVTAGVAPLLTDLVPDVSLKDLLTAASADTAGPRRIESNNSTSPASNGGAAGAPAVSPGLTPTQPAGGGGSQTSRPRKTSIVGETKLSSSGADASVSPGLASKASFSAPSAKAAAATGRRASVTVNPLSAATAVTVTSPGLLRRRPQVHRRTAIKTGLRTSNNRQVSGGTKSPTKKLERILRDVKKYEAVEAGETVSGGDASEPSSDDEGAPGTVIGTSPAPRASTAVPPSPHSTNSGSPKAVALSVASGSTTATKESKATTRLLPALPGSKGMVSSFQPPTGLVSTQMASLTAKIDLALSPSSPMGGVRGAADATDPYKQSLLPKLSLTAATARHGAYPRVRSNMVNAVAPTTGAAATLALPLPNLLQTTAPSHLSLMCFSFPQNGKFEYGSEIHADLVAVGRAFNPLFADQLLTDFCSGDRRRIGSLSFTDFCEYTMQLCRQFDFHPMRFERQTSKALSSGIVKSATLDADTSIAATASQQASLSINATMSMQSASRQTALSMAEIPLGPDASAAGGGGMRPISPTAAGDEQDDFAASTSQAFIDGASAVVALLPSMSSREKLEAMAANRAIVVDTVATRIPPVSAQVPPLHTAIKHYAKHVWIEDLNKKALDEDASLADFALLVTVPAGPLAPLFHEEFTWMRRSLVDQVRRPKRRASSLNMSANAPTRVPSKSVGPAA